VKSFFWRWRKRLPSPLTRADVRAGYVYELAFRQFEVSDTRVFDRPAAGRSFFEQLIQPTRAKPTSPSRQSGRSASGTVVFTSKRRTPTR
jgi:hypothetical protein